MPGGESAVTRADGRTLRRERNETAVVDAILQLLNEGRPTPGAAEIAARAGVSVRSVFRRFEDLGTLFSAAVDRQVEQVGHLFEAPPSGGSRSSRVAALVDQRRRLYEAIAPVRRAAVRHAPGRATVRERLDQSHRLLRRQVRDLFTEELDRLPTGERAELLDALDAASSWQAWDALRGDLGLSAGRAAAVMARTLGSLLGGR